MRSSMPTDASAKGAAQIRASGFFFGSADGVLPGEAMALSKSIRAFIRAEMRADQFTCDKSKLVRAEAKFVGMAMGKMMAVHRPSWPDFICMIDGKIVGVEVKGLGDWIRPNQRRTFDILEQFNVLRVFIWDETNPRKLVAWKTAKTRQYQKAREQREAKIQRTPEAQKQGSEKTTAQYVQPGLQASPSPVVSRH